MPTVLISYCELKEPVAEATYQRYWNSLPPGEQAKLNRLRRQSDRDLSFVGKLLLMDQLKSSYESAPSLSKLKYNAHGRPYMDASFDFNISHTTDLVMCAIGEMVQVGIDCEKVSAVDPAEFNAFFSEEELKSVGTSQQRFFELWCRKEALIKAIGVGVYADLTQLSVLADSCVYGGEMYHFYKLPVSEAYCAVLACNWSDVQITIKVIQPADL